MHNTNIDVQYQELVEAIHSQPWSELIDWPKINTLSGALWVYTHGSAMHDSEAIVIEKMGPNYFLVDVPNPDLSISGDTDVIIDRLHECLLRRKGHEDTSVP